MEFPSMAFGMDPQARRFMWNIISDISTKRQKSAVILTTHSMEEAEALSTKMGIMVKGLFKCFGSSQHIKNKFGTGYELDIKIRNMKEEEEKEAISKFGLPEKFSLSNSVELLKRLPDGDKLAGQLTMEGMGRELVAELQKTPQLPIEMLLTWHFTEFNGRRLLKDLLEDFEKVEMLEHYGQYYKLRVPKGDKSIGFLFGLLERIGEASQVSEYSASQTTLEQIFNGFATEGDEVKKTRTVFYS